MAKNGSVYTRDFDNGAWVTCSYEGTDNRLGMVISFDNEDGEYYVCMPPDTVGADWRIQQWDNGWVDHQVSAAEPPEGFAPDKPDHIFMVIRPSRKITTYANLDALLAGMAGEGVATAERDEQVRQAAMEAIADPETDIKIPPGASNSPWLRFTQVEGA